MGTTRETRVSAREHAETLSILLFCNIWRQQMWQDEGPWDQATFDKPTLDWATVMRVTRGYVAPLTKLDTVASGLAPNFRR